MASYLLPRRGAYSSISSTVLKQGEIFFETTNGVGGGKGRIMMGNGTNAYSALVGSSKYFLDVDTTPVAFTDITASDSTALNTLAGSLTASACTLPTMARVLKRALYNMNALLAGKAATSHGNHVPATQTASNKVFLRNDNTWQTVTPANIGAAATSHGNHVPATQTASNKVFLRNDNTWQTVTPANIGAAASSHTHKNSEISNLAFGTYVYNGSSVDNFYFTHSSLKGFSYVIVQAQDAGSIKNASIDSSAGKITVRLTAAAIVCRVCYCAFKIE